MEKISILKSRWFKNEIDNLQTKGMSKADISRDLDILPQYLNSLMNGSRNLTDQFLDKFIEAYNINQFDLLSNSDIKAITYTPNSPEGSSVQILIESMTNLISQKDSVIQEQAKEIGKLEQTITQLRRELGDTVSAANGSTIASVG
ncbi:helix-turn-helix domain-containing protein [Parabacteroides sp. ASD2025]|uniref:helix-turn-helix domain-containing protein n=1 Tax=Parabacteroides sp. ASD2025 TaxID=3415987 RepID=UPI003CEF1A33